MLDLPVDLDLDRWTTVLLWRRGNQLQVIRFYPFTSAGYYISLNIHMYLSDVLINNILEYPYISMVLKG